MSQAEQHQLPAVAQRQEELEERHQLPARAQQQEELEEELQQEQPCLMCNWSGKKGSGNYLQAPPAEGNAAFLFSDV